MLVHSSTKIVFMLTINQSMSVVCLICLNKFVIIPNIFSLLTNVQREVVSKIWCIWVPGKKESRLQFARELRGCEAALGLILMFELRRRCILLHKLGKIFAIWFRWGCTALRWRFQLFGNPALCQIFVYRDEDIFIFLPKSQSIQSNAWNRIRSKMQRVHF